MKFTEYNKIHFHKARQQFEENQTRFSFAVGFSERDNSLDIVMDEGGLDLLKARKILLKAIQLINDQLDRLN